MADVKLTQDRESLFKNITAAFGKDSIMMLAHDTTAQILHWGSTGVYSLDDIMAWGLPGGRFVEFFGPESSGKTTALMAAMIENEFAGGINVVFDAEGTFDQDRYRQMGGDPSKIIMIDPGTMEQYYDKLKRVVAWAKLQVIPETALVLIGVDSMPMLIPKAVLELEGNEQTVAEQSRINSRHLPTIDKALAANTCIVLLNQVRDKIGAMAWSAEGNIDTPGGRIIKHICSVRVLFSKAGQIDNGQKAEKRVIIGMKTEAKVVKNKVGPPLRKTGFRIMFDHRGVDNVRNCLDAFVAKKVIPAPVSGIYKVKDKTIKAEEFAHFIAKHPKWTEAALSDTFELYHKSINVARYLAAPTPAEVKEEAD